MVYVSYIKYVERMVSIALRTTSEHTNACYLNDMLHGAFGHHFSIIITIKQTPIENHIRLRILATQSTVYFDLVFHSVPMYLMCV